jgi:hypothetical protein
VHHTFQAVFFPYTAPLATLLFYVWRWRFYLLPDMCDCLLYVYLLILSPLYFWQKSSATTICSSLQHFCFYLQFSSTAMPLMYKSWTFASCHGNQTSLQLFSTFLWVCVRNGLFYVNVLPRSNISHTCVHVFEYDVSDRQNINLCVEKDYI